MASVKGFASSAKRSAHFAKHGSTCACATESAYEKKALAFFARADHSIRISKRPNNDVIYFDYTTNEFGIVTPAGFIRTYFLPNPATHKLPRNLDYYFAESVSTK